MLFEVLLEGAPVRVLCALELACCRLQGAASGCCFWMLLLVWCVRFGGGLLLLLQGTTAGCCFRVLLLKCCVRFGPGLLLVPLQGAASGCYQNGVCALELPAGAGAGAAAGCCFTVALSEWRVRFGAGAN